MMRFENQLPGGSSNTASGEAECRVATVNGYTEILLRHAGAIARALNDERVSEGREWVAKRFVTNDHPEGFFLRVTERQALWVVPAWAPCYQFEAAEVSFCRSTDPAAVAIS